MQVIRVALKFYANLLSSSPNMGHLCNCETSIFLLMFVCSSTVCCTAVPCPSSPFIALSSKYLPPLEQGKVLNYKQTFLSYVTTINSESMK